MGRRPSGKLPAQPLKYITERHHEIMRRIIAGETQHKIAVELGMTEGRLSIICNSPAFQEALAQKKGKVEDRFIENIADVKGRVEKLQDKAMDVLETIINNTTLDDGTVVPLRLRKETALNILEIAGNGKKTADDKKGDNIGDVIELIKEGYKLAMSSVNNGNNINNNIVRQSPQTPINITPVYTDVIPTVLDADADSVHTEIDTDTEIEVEAEEDKEINKSFIDAPSGFSTPLL